ncbi:MAG: alpha/beta fold hydrolase [Jatrophihabitans sp.]
MSEAGGAIRKPLAEQRPDRAGDNPDLDPFRLADGTLIGLLDLGPSDADATVVLVHGWTQDHTSWDDVVERLQTTCPELRVIAYDARGHGWSDAGPRGSSTIDQFADDLAEIITILVPHGSVVLAGHSLGGPVIMSFAERHPALVRKRVRGVALVATSAAGLGKDIFGLSGRLTAPVMLAAPLVTKVRSWSRAPMNLRRPGAIAAALRLGLYGPGAATRHNRNRTAAQVGRSHPATTAQLVNEMVGHDRLHTLGELDRTPTVVLAGTKDALCPMAHSRAMAQAMPNAELVVYPQAGHMLPYERAEQVSDQLVRLAGMTAGRPS